MIYYESSNQRNVNLDKEDKAYMRKNVSILNLRSIIKQRKMMTGQINSSLSHFLAHITLNYDF